MTKDCKIVALTEEIVNKSLADKSITDFEDGIQFHSASTASCDCIITRNVRDFETVRDRIVILTPEEVLSR